MSSIVDDFTAISAWTIVVSRRINVEKEITQRAMSKHIPNESLGEYVKARRESRCLTKLAAAKLAGLDVTYWRKLENGEYQSPSPRALASIAQTIGAPLADLYGLAGYASSDRLPTFAPYLRSRYSLPPEAVAQLEGYFDFLRNQYGIPADESVFPSRATPADTTADDSAVPNDDQITDAEANDGGLA